MFLRSFRQERNRLLFHSKKWHEIAVKRVAMELSNRLLESTIPDVGRSFGDGILFLLAIQRKINPPRRA